MLARSDEKIVYEAEKHPISLLGVYIFAPIGLFCLLGLIGTAIASKSMEPIIGGIFICLIFAIPITYSILRFKLDKIVITDKTFYLQQGVINIEKISLPLSKVQSMMVKQGLLGRIFNFGDIVYQSASSTGTSMYKNVKNPHELTNIINENQF